LAIGDSIQFMRYVARVAERASNIVVECETRLIDLFTRYQKIASFVRKGEALPHFDVHSSLLSLPGIFKTSLETIPRDTGYISLDKSLCDKWKQKLDGLGSVKIGLCWQGNRKHKRDLFRSIQLEKLSRLLEVEKVSFISLQKGYGEEQIEHYHLGSKISDFSSEIDTFSDTAALISQLDLVIGVDTSTIHLAGAMGKPVWVLLPHAPDWRWMLKREDSPWYPTMRLFRQQESGEWGPVIDEIINELGKTSG